MTITEFIKTTPNAYLCAENLSKILDKEGYKKIYNGKIDADKVYAVSGDATIIALDLKGNTGFNIIAAHSDSPAFHLKPGFLSGGKPTFEPYGGMILSSWFDRPLSLSGRIVCEKNGEYYTKSVNIDEDIAVIPSLAIHQNREANDGHKVNPQTEMCPVFSCDLNEKLSSFLNDGERMLSCDLYLYDRTEPKTAGDLLISPRIDDLACVYGAYNAFLTEPADNMKVLAVFNGEEIGSNTLEGADGTFLSDILKAACEYKGIDYNETLLSSMLISADNGHAFHENYPDKTDPDNKCFMGSGIMIKHHINYTTTALTDALFSDICKKADVPVQHFACRSDMKCGSTLGNINLRHIPVISVDVGLPQLAMHSACETCSLTDAGYLRKAFTAFYQTGIEFSNGIYKLK